MAINTVAAMRARVLASLAAPKAASSGGSPTAMLARILPLPVKQAPGTISPAAPIAPPPAPDTQAATGAVVYGDTAGSFTAPAASSVDDLTPPDPAATATPAAPGISPLLIVGGLVVAWLVFGRKH
jgi:hypothetical protein